MRPHSLSTIATALLLVLSACGLEQKETVTPDTTPPSAIADLVQTALTDSSAFLFWTAPGDDGDEGTAKTYDARFYGETITEGNWALASTVDGEPAPQLAGSAESMEVVLTEGTSLLTALAEDQSFYIAIRTSDESENWSALSNILGVVLQDVTPPSSITDLALTAQTDSSAFISWTAPGDDAEEGTATAYGIRFHHETLTEANWDTASPVNEAPTPQAAGSAESMEIVLDAAGQTLITLAVERVFYIGIRASDAAGNASGISNSLRVALDDIAPPGPITDLAFTALSDSSAFLSWTAPGDDGFQGTAEDYDVRFHLDPLTDDTWEAAEAADGEPIPQAAGTTESMELVLGAPGVGSTGSEDKTFHIGIRSVDTAGNASGLSNVLSVVLPDWTAPGTVSDLALTSQSDSSAFVSWTAPGDNGDEGTATAYDLRFHIESITEMNWDAATAVTGEPTPQTAGSPESMEVVLLQSGPFLSLLAEHETFYMALRTQDEADNASGLSNVLTVTLEPVVTFADPNLLAQVRTALGIPTGAITVDDMLELGPSFDVREKDIADLSGLEAAANLLFLDVGDNVISNLLPLQDMPQLEELELDDNVIVDISSLEHLVNLKKLNIEDNFVTDLSPLAVLTTMTELKASQNNIVDISALSSLTGLETLELHHNKVGDISAVSGMAQLAFLHLGNTQVSNLAPLASNVDFAAGDEVQLFYCPLSQTSLDTHIATLEAQGAVVTLGDDVWPPATVLDLSIADISDTSMTLTWTSPGGSSRTSAATYDIRYHTAMIDDTNWGEADQAQGEPAPQPFGQTETFEVVFPSGPPLLTLGPNGSIQSSYYLALRSRDENDNESGLSNVVLGELLNSMLKEPAPPK